MPSGLANKEKQRVRQLFAEGKATRVAALVADELLGAEEVFLKPVPAGVGMPTLCDGLAVLAEGRAVIGKRARVHAGVSTFVPKPHTPFQWAPQISVAEGWEKIQWIKQALRSPRIRLKWQNPEVSYIEGLMARGDRRMADLIEHAYRKGCRLDGWSDHFRFDLWEESIRDLDLDAHVYVHRPRAPEEVFFFPRNVFPERVHILGRVPDQAFAGHGRARRDGLDVVAQRLARFRNIAMLGADAFEALGEFWFLGAHCRVQDVLFGMVHGIRVDRHVVHDVVKKIHVGLSLVRNVFALGLEQVEQSGEVSMVLAQFFEDPGELDTHSKSTSFYHGYHACRASGG